MVHAPGPRERPAQSGRHDRGPRGGLRANDVLAEVDFGSLGTNDLAQYTMAADRMQGALRLLDPWQPAVLDVIAAALRVPTGLVGRSGVRRVGGDRCSHWSWSGSVHPACRWRRARSPSCGSRCRHSLAECQQLAVTAREARTAQAGPSVRA